MAYIHSFKKRKGNKEEGVFLGRMRKEIVEQFIELIMFIALIKELITTNCKVFFSLSFWIVNLFQLIN